MDNQKGDTPAQKITESGIFIRDIIWVAIAQVLTLFVVGIAALPALTKHYGPEIYGIWVQISVTVTLLSPFIAMELDMSVIRFLAGEEDKVKRRKSLGSMLISIIIFSIMVFLLINIIAPQLSGLLFADPKYVTFIRLTFIWVITDALYIFFSSYFRARKKIRFLSIRQVSYGIAFMLIIIIMSSMGIKLEWLVGCIIVMQSVFVLLFFFLIVKEIGYPIPNINGIQEYLAFSLPQIPGVALIWVIGSSDRYFITHFLDLSQAGIYSSSSQIAVLTRLFYSPISYVLYPTLSRLWDENRFSEVRSYLQHSIRLLLTLGIPASIGIAMLSQPILKILTTTEFLAGRELVFFIALGTVFMGIYQINSQVILLKKQTRLLPLIIGAASVTSMILNIVLIPNIGISGASIAYLASCFLLAVIASFIARRSTNYSYDGIFQLKITVASLPMAIYLFLIKVDKLWEIILAAAAGAVIFVSGVLLLRAFPEKEKQLVKNIILNLLPTSMKKKNN